MELLICVVLIPIVVYLLNPKVYSLLYREIKQMAKNQTFNRAFVVYTIIFILTSLCIYSFVPRYLALMFSESYLRECGQVGDIIGGTTGPLIAIAASFLTFLAFWVQYKANKQQRNDISLERFESRFYEMLRLHRENLFDLSCGEVKGRDAMVGYCHKLMLVFNLIDKLPMNFFGEEELSIYMKYCEENFGGKYQKMISAISFNLFLYGGNFLHSFKLDSDERVLFSAIIKEIEAFESYCITYSSSATYTYENAILDDYLELYSTNDKQPLKIELPDGLLCGYNAKLGVYFRQLFQMVKLISLREGLSEKERYAYVKIVRSQLSDYEQILLYYNSLTKVGSKWNQVMVSPNIEQKTTWISDMRLIPRFKLIKNIPASFPMFGWVPEREYESEIDMYLEKNINKPFFESRNN